MRRDSRRVAVLLVAIACALAIPAVALAAGQPPVNLGTSSTYGVLARRDITNAGTTSITGDLGTLFGPLAGAPITVNAGVTHNGDAAAQVAITDAEAAAADAQSRTPATTLPGTEIGGLTLLPGVYRPQQVMDWFLNGTLTLDAQGDPNAVWVFQDVPVLHAMPGSHVNLVNGARFCRVFWDVYVADLQAGSEFEGHILASDRIDMANGATMRGQLIAIGNVEAFGTINLSNNRIDNSICTTWTPSLPKTGYPPERSANLPWALSTATFAAIVLTATAAVRRRSQRGGPA